MVIIALMWNQFMMTYDDLRGDRHILQPATCCKQFHAIFPSLFPPHFQSLPFQISPWSKLDQTWRRVTTVTTGDGDYPLVDVSIGWELGDWISVGGWGWLMENLAIFSWKKSVTLNSLFGNFSIANCNSFPEGGTLEVLLPSYIPIMLPKVRLTYLT